MKKIWLIQFLCATAAALWPYTPSDAQSRNEPLRIKVTEGIIEPISIAVPDFDAENDSSVARAEQITRVVLDDLTGTGLFREVPKRTHLNRDLKFGTLPRFTDWRAINVEVLATGSVRLGEDGRTEVKFRAFDVVVESEIGSGLKFSAENSDWRRIAHRIADVLYERLVGEEGHFDTQIAFVAESGPKDDRIKRIAIMDYDGANISFPSNASAIALAPKFSPDGSQLVFTSYSSGLPRATLMELSTGNIRPIIQESEMSFSPRFSPDGNKIILSQTLGRNTDIFEIDLKRNTIRQLTSAPAIDTSPSYSPDGGRIVFESDRDGSRQLYIKNLENGATRKLTSGSGKFGTPAWSPRGDYIAFTKQFGNQFQIGIIREDGRGERILAQSYLDEGPTWAPNGRVLMFFRETPGANGGPSLYTVNANGSNLKRVETGGFASDPSWSPRRK